MWERFGVTQPDAGVLDQLLTRYSEPHRKYHTTRHLDECLARFEELRTEAKHPEEVEFALWFHDAIYDTTRHDNEAKSAEWARATAVIANLPAVKQVQIMVEGREVDTIAGHVDVRRPLTQDTSLIREPGAEGEAGVQ